MSTSEDLLENSVCDGCVGLNISKSSSASQTAGSVPCRVKMERYRWAQVPGPSSGLGLFIGLASGNII